MFHGRIKMAMRRLKSVGFVLYRSGTSRGPYLLASELPPPGCFLPLPAHFCYHDSPCGSPCSEWLSLSLLPGDSRDAVICNVMGSGHPQQLEGFGGGDGPTSKAVIVGATEDPDAVSFTFAQCRVADASVDHSHGDCGNMVTSTAVLALLTGRCSWRPSVRLLSKVG